MILAELIGGLVFSVGKTPVLAGFSNREIGEVA